MSFFYVPRTNLAPLLFAQGTALLRRDEKQLFGQPRLNLRDGESLCLQLSNTF